MAKGYFNNDKNLQDIFSINRSILGIEDLNKNAKRIFFTKKEKTEKEQEHLKKLVRYYEYLGFQQVDNKWEKFTKLYELAYGKINEKDFKQGKENYNNIVKKLDSTLSTEDNIEETSLKFFPLIPPIVNSIINDYDKKYTKMYVKAINPEAINDIIESKNKELRELLVNKATELFEATLENLEEEQRKAQLDIFQKSQKIQEYYQKDHRLEVELWANHHLNIEDEKYSIKNLKKKVLEKVLVTDHPYLLVDFNGYDYKYKLVDERNCFFLKSPLDDDASQYMMFGEFTYSTIDNIIGKYKLSEEQAKKLESWSEIINGVPYQKYAADPNQDYLEVTHNNLLYHKGLHSNQEQYGFGIEYLDNYYEHSEIPPNLIRETKIHFKLPRKKGELTYLVNGVRYTDIVDEDYKIYIKPDYDLTWTKERTSSNLVNGEHIDWFYETESYTAIKLDLASRNMSNIQNDYNTIWISIDKDPVQIKDPFRRFTTILPVHGGSSTQMSESTSLVEKGEEWQTMYTFLGNRCQNLLATEIGLFFVLNQGVIPHESFDGSWEENNLLKWGQLAHDFGITPISTDVNQLSGQNTFAVGTGFGQTIDLTKTNDVIAKLNLMQGIKREFYSSLGISPEHLAEISPYQSGKSVAQGLQRSSNMIHHYFARAEEIVKKARQTGLFIAKYLQEKNPKDLIYTNSEGASIVFRTSGKYFSLADLAIYLKDDLEDNDKLQDLYALVLNDNTLGADLYEKSSVLFAKTSSQVMSELKKLKLEKEIKLQEQREYEQSMQQQQIEAQKEQLIEIENRKDLREKQKQESDKEIAEIKALGYANSNVEEIQKAIQEAKKEADDTREYDLKLRDIIRKENADKDKTELEATKSKQNLISNESMELMKIKLREKEIEASKERTSVLKKLGTKK